MKESTDVETAFQLLDIIQGHPGYEVKCFQCGGPLTDILGVVLPDVQWQQHGLDPGPKHYDSLWGDICPIYAAAQLQQDMTALMNGPRGPFF